MIHELNYEKCRGIPWLIKGSRCLVKSCKSPFMGTANHVEKLKLRLSDARSEVLRTMTNALWFVTGTSMSKGSASVSGSSCVYSNHVSEKPLRVDKASGSLSPFADQAWGQAISHHRYRTVNVSTLWRNLKILVALLPGF